MERIVTVGRIGPSTFDVVTRSEQRLVARAGASSGGDPGPSPMELMLASVATCTADTLASVLDKMRLDLRDLGVVVDAERSAGVPRVWTRVLVRCHVRADGPFDRVARAVEITGRTCPASVMVGRAADLTHLVYQVCEVAAEETVPVRHAVLRAGRPVESVRTPGEDEAIWFGALGVEGVVGTAGLFRDRSPHGDLRLRGMATLPSVRGTGLGGMLIDALVERGRADGGTALWCNARTPAVGFYERFGFSVVSDRFDIEGIGPHVVMRREL